LASVFVEKRRAYVQAAAGTAEDMQRFKERTGKAFPTHGEVIKVAVALGYRKRLDDEAPTISGTETPFPRRFEPD